MGGRFPTASPPLGAHELAELGYGLKAEHPGGAEHLAALDREIQSREIARLRSEKIQRYTDMALNPLFFWHFCVAVCQFTMHLFS